MADNPYIDDMTDSDVVEPAVTVVVRASPESTEAELRAEAEHHLLEGYGLGELRRQYREGDEVVFEFATIHA